MGGTTYSILTWKQRATSMSQQPKFNLAEYKINSLSHDYEEALRSGLNQPNAMSMEKAERFVDSCVPGTLASFDMIRAEMIQKVARTGHL